jgi:hypothetical protein
MSTSHCRLCTGLADCDGSIGGAQPNTWHVLHGWRGNPGAMPSMTYQRHMQLPAVDKRFIAGDEVNTTAQDMVQPP